MQVKRSNLHGALQDLAKAVGVSFKTSSRVVDYNFDKPSLTLERGQKVEHDFIIAADGKKELLRDETS